MRPSLPKIDDYLAYLEAAWQEHLAPRAADAPTVISTFAGCGGSSLGYSMAGFRELLAVEWDDNAVETFRLNFPEVPVYHGDIGKLTVEECLQLAGVKPGELDVFDGSPPCQGFSTAGKRQMDDSRNQLFREYVRLLRGLQPKVFVMENVSGMVKGKMKLIFAEILRELKASGYRVSARLMNAMYFGVPQSRQRMIFIGVREDIGKEPSHPHAETCPVSIANAWERLIQDDYTPDIRPYAIGHEWHQIRIGGKSARYFSLVRPIETKPCPTLTKGCGQIGMASVVHPYECRKLTLAESKRVASFPDAILFAGTWGNSTERIGNSVPPLFMRAIAEHIRTHLLPTADRL